MKLIEAHQALYDGLRVFHFEWPRSWKFVYRELGGGLKLRVASDDDASSSDVRATHFVHWHDDDGWYVVPECNSCSFCNNCAQEWGRIAVDIPDNADDLIVCLESFPAAVSRMSRDFLIKSFAKKELKHGVIKVDFRAQVKK